MMWAVLGLRETEGPIRLLERTFCTRARRVGRGGGGAELEDAIIKLEESKIKRGAGRAYTSRVE